jgi:hypothetical protein
MLKTLSKKKDLNTKSLLNINNRDSRGVIINIIIFLI